MRPAQLSFFDEQTGAALCAVSQRPEVIASLQRLGARVTMGLRDLSAERAEAVQRLEAAGVGVDVWLLLERDDGYFATPENVDAVARRLDALFTWAAAHRLEVRSVGFDFEPALDELDDFFRAPLPRLWRWARRARHHQRRVDAEARYRQLVQQLTEDGVRCESYVFPLVLEDRAVGSHFFSGLVNGLEVGVEREVVMAYSSLLGPLGPGLVEGWSREGRAIAVGSTGGGVDPFPPLRFEALERDLRWAARAATDVRIFCLEGCVRQGFLPRLEALRWDEAPPPVASLQRWGSASARALARGLSRALR